MDGIISNFRMNRHSHSSNQMIVLVGSVTNKENASKLIGKKVVFNTGKKDISGEITGAHGNKGAVKVRFSQGMPGQAIGQKVKIN